MQMLRSHPGALDGVDRDSGRIPRAMTAPGRRNEPVVVVGRDQNEFPPAMPRNLDRLTQGPMLKLAELALKLDSCGLRHARLEYRKRIICSIRNRRFSGSKTSDPSTGRRVRVGTGRQRKQNPARLKGGSADGRIRRNLSPLARASGRILG